MENLLGIPHIQIKKITCGHSEGIIESQVNDFLEQHDGHIINIRFLFTSLTVTAFITYKK